MTKPSRELSKFLITAVRMGQILVIESIGETLDPLLDPVLSKTFDQQSAAAGVSGFRTMNIANNSVEFNNDFRLYLISSLPNPHYIPEILTKVTLLNYTVTRDGLKD